MRTATEVIKRKGPWAEEAIHIKFCGGQEEPGSIMLVKLVTGSCHEQKSSNCPNQSEINGFNKQWDLKKKPFDVKACLVIRVQCMCALIN